MNKLAINKLITLVFASLLLVGTAAAQDRSGAARQQGTQQGSMRMMDREHMTQMREHMTQMSEIRERFQSEADPERRQELMQEHFQAMQESMNMMGQGRQGEMPENMNMEQRMEMMQNQMQAMHMMMQQMMEQHDMMRQQREGNE